MRARLAVAAVFVASTFATQARATLYNWTYVDGNHSGSGTLTTTGATSPFTITAITGTFDGFNILSLLPPGHCCAAPGNNNLLYSPPSTLLDGNGIAFETLASPGFYNMVFFNGAYSVLDDNGIMTFDGTFTATLAPGPGPSIPEPASLGMVAAGFAGLVAFSRRRQRA